MLERFRALLRAPEAKTSRAAQVIAFESGGRPRWTPRDFAALAREGYARNAIAYRAVKMIAEGAAQLPLLAYEDAMERPQHAALALLTRPNPRQDGIALMEAVYTHLLLAGNAYLEAVILDGAVREIYALRPDRMRVVPGPDGWPAAYDYTAGGRTVRFTQSDAPIPPVLHIALANPLDDHYGIAPLEAAAVALDTHNAASRWNKALLDNAARPSGALVYAGPEGALLSDAQFERLKRELENTYQGSANAGRPLLLEGGLEWKAMSLSPKDMDFLEARNAAAREIALAFGVPPMLLGIPGDNTYANLQEASRTLWRQTILPLTHRVTGALSQWLAPAFGERLRLAADADGVDALATERSAAWKRIGDTDVLTINEKREALGYAPLPGGDVLG
ncbi:MAG: phage portal protein [Rhizobiales bacterium]|nr:phage portal protein [Hyphomicrobiales bacterium]